MKIKIYILSFLLFSAGFSSCSRNVFSGNSVNAYKPVKHRRPYDPKKDKRKERLKIVKMKS